MVLSLPDLDDRRWVDLVEEGRALIPFNAPDWTDHNIHDPGITTMELFAWIAEMDLYQLNRTSAEHKRKILALIGLNPLPPRPSHSGMSPTVPDGATTLTLPVADAFEG